MLLRGLGVQGGRSRKGLCLGVLPDSRGKGVPAPSPSPNPPTPTRAQARRFGVRSAMPGFIAVRLCPQLVFVAPDFPKYVAASEATRTVFRDYDPDFRAGSLDEVGGGAGGCWCWGGGRSRGQALEVRAVTGVVVRAPRSCSKPPPTPPPAGLPGRDRLLRAPRRDERAGGGRCGGVATCAVKGAWQDMRIASMARPTRTLARPASTPPLLAGRRRDPPASPPGDGRSHLQRRRRAQPAARKGAPGGPRRQPPDTLRPAARASTPLPLFLHPLPAWFPQPPPYPLPGRV
jgi:hypothetical protein